MGLSASLFRIRKCCEVWSARSGRLWSLLKTFKVFWFGSIRAREKTPVEVRLEVSRKRGEELKSV